MNLQESVITRKRGPKATGKGRLIGVRLHKEHLAGADTRIARQPDRPSLPEAIRRLVAMGLKGQ